MRKPETTTTSVDGAAPRSAKNARTAGRKKGSRVAAPVRSARSLVHRFGCVWRLIFQTGATINAKLLFKALNRQVAFRARTDHRTSAQWTKFLVPILALKHTSTRFADCFGHGITPFPVSTWIAWITTISTQGRETLSSCQGTAAANILSEGSGPKSADFNRQNSQSATVHEAGEAIQGLQPTGGGNEDSLRGAESEEIRIGGGGSKGAGFRSDGKGL